MTNLSKNGGRQTALDLGDSPKKGADAFDEAAYRAELIAAGIPAGDAAAVAAKTAEARRQRDYVPGNVGASLKLPAAVKRAVQKVERAQENAVPAKKARSSRAVVLTPQENKLLDVATDIATTPPSGEDMAFTHAVLCQVGLPRAKVEGHEFMRQSGAAWVNVQAGYLDEGKGPVQQPIPYGVMPRLALAWVSTYAVPRRAGNPHR